MKASKRRQAVVLASGLLMLAILVIITIPIHSDVQAGPYPTQMEPKYSGMVKPQLDLNDYKVAPGFIGNHYSTAYNGRYLTEDEQGNITYYPEDSGNHPGVDIQLGDCILTPIRAIAEGQIVDKQTAQEGDDLCGEVGNGWGNLIVIQHDNIPLRDGFGGTAFSVYAHLSSFENNPVIGDKVLRGTIIGYQGSTGGSTGPHLHFQMDRQYDRAAGPYWPTRFGFSCCDNDSDQAQDHVEAHTFNPMYFVQAHMVDTEFYAAAYTEYFNDTQLTDLEWSASEGEIDHEWFDGGPVVPADNFSARWGSVQGESVLYIPFLDAWTFYVTVDDGVRLWRRTAG